MCPSTRTRGGNSGLTTPTHRLCLLSLGLVISVLHESSKLKQGVFPVLPKLNDRLEPVCVLCVCVRESVCVCAQGSLAPVGNGIAQLVSALHHPLGGEQQLVRQVMSLLEMI